MQQVIQEKRAWKTNGFVMAGVGLIALLLGGVLLLAGSALGFSSAPSSAACTGELRLLDQCGETASRKAARMARQKHP